MTTTTTPEKAEAEEGVSTTPRPPAPRATSARRKWTKTGAQKRRWRKGAPGNRGRATPADAREKRPEVTANGTRMRTK